MNWRFLAILSLCLFLGACANANSIYRNEDISYSAPNARVVTSDAKQRHLIASELYDPLAPSSRDGKPAKRWAFCAEASPDVFSALSTSASGEVNASGLLKGATDKALQARIALALTEAAGTIERTQTINLLRESMYRTCERYIDGAIGRDEFIVQSARDQRNMVAILAIEQLTRAVWPQATVINAGGASANATGNPEIIAELKKASDAAVDADANQKLASSGYNATKCDAILKAAAPAAGDAARPDYDACTVDKKSLDDANLALAKANASLANIKALAAAAPAGSVSAVAGSGGSASQVNVSVDRATMDQVAGKVENIVRMSYDFDEGEMLCISKFRSDYSQIDIDLRDVCISLLKSKIKATTAEYDAKVASLRAAGAQEVEPAADEFRDIGTKALACWTRNPTAFVAAAKVAGLGKDYQDAFASGDARRVVNALSFLDQSIAASITSAACPGS